MRSASPRSQQPLSSLWHSRARDVTRAARTSETLRPTAPPTASLSSHTSLTCFTCMLHALDSDSPVSLSLSLSLSLKTSRGPPLREVRRQVPNLRLVRAPVHPRAHLRRVQLRLIPGKVPYTFFFHLSFISHTPICLHHVSQLPFLLISHSDASSRSSPGPVHHLWRSGNLGRVLLQGVHRVRERRARLDPPTHPPTHHTTHLTPPPPPPAHLPPQA